MKKRMLIVFGTRPEAIKMCPLVKEFCKRGKMEVRVCVSGQHREMLKPVSYTHLDVYKRQAYQRGAGDY